MQRVRIPTVAVVGAGAAGFYAAQSVLQRCRQALVHVFEQHWSPYGLVRYGVAPDHPEVKAVESVFDALAARPNVRVCFGVSVGDGGAPPAAADVAAAGVPEEGVPRRPRQRAPSVSIAQLRDAYDFVIVASGSSPRGRRVPGVRGADKGLRGVLTAAELVGWYNGAPAFQHVADARMPELCARRAVIVGVGNVALDCARILVRGRAALQPTDITSASWEVLRDRIRPRQVLVSARRSLLHAACTTKELRELVKLESDLVVSWSPALVQSAAADEIAAARVQRTTRRMVELMESLATPRDLADASDDAAAPARGVHLAFMCQPVEYVAHRDDPTRVGAVVLRESVLCAPGPAGAGSAAVQRRDVLVPCDMVVESVGFESQVIDGLPVDPEHGHVQNTGGVVRMGDSGRVFVCGWAKHGPRGTLADTKFDAEETVASMPLPAAVGATDAADAASWPATHAEQLARVLGRDVAAQVPGFDRWLRISAAEIAAGAALGKCREKFVTATAPSAADA